MKIILTLAEAKEIIFEHEMFEGLPEGTDIVIEGFEEVVEPKTTEDKPKQRRTRRKKATEEVVETQEQLDLLVAEADEQLAAEATNEIIQDEPVATDSMEPTLQESSVDVDTTNSVDDLFVTEEDNSLFHETEADEPVIVNESLFPEEPESLFPEESTPVREEVTPLFG